MGDLARLIATSAFMAIVACMVLGETVIRICEVIG